VVKPRFGGQLFQKRTLPGFSSEALMWLWVHETVGRVVTLDHD